MQEFGVVDYNDKQLGIIAVVGPLAEQFLFATDRAAPERIREAWEEKRFGRWIDVALGDVPVNYLSNCDTTGGNSGSPSIDRRGRLVGVNFDRVWENVANDFGYNPEIARNVTADVRYLLWLLDEVEEADALLEELGVAGGEGQGLLDQLADREFLIGAGAAGEVDLSVAKTDGEIEI